MKRITFQKIVVRDFKGIDKQAVTFCDGVTALYGANYTGKTSLMDAIYWCLFGKSLTGDTRFGVQPIGKKTAVPIVELTINVDGTPHMLTRKLNGSVTACEIDGAPMQLSEYNAWVDANVEDIERFKLFSNPMYFATLHWTKQRELFTSFFETPPADEVVAAMAQDKVTLVDEFGTLIKTMSADKIQDKMGKEIKELETERNGISARIDEKTRDIDGRGALDTSALEQEREGLKAQWDSMAEDRKAADELTQKIADKRSEIYSMQADKDMTLATAKMDVREKQSRYAQEIAGLEARKNSLRYQWQDIEKSNIETVCPTCKQAIPADKVAAAQAEAAKAKADIETEGKQIAEKIKQYEKERAALDAAGLPEETEKAVEVIENSIAKIRGEIEVLEKQQADTPPVQSAEIKDRLYNIERMLSSAERLQTDIKRRDELIQSLSKTAREIEMRERIKKDAGQYILYQAKVTVEKVNKQFKGVQIELFEYLKNGNVKETFSLLYNGVPYQDVSSTERVIIGLEINEYLKKALGVSVPTIIDNFESYMSIGLSELPRQSIVSIVDAEQGDISVVHG